MNTNLSPWTNSLSPQEVALIELALLQQQGNDRLERAGLTGLIAKLALANKVEVTFRPQANINDLRRAA